MRHWLSGDILEEIINFYFYKIRVNLIKSSQ